ncbi:unnamed protein product, partial [Acidithrix sp. C25]
VMTEIAPERNPHLAKILEFGTSPWIDNITRDWFVNGKLSELIALGVVGLTSNPSIFSNAISSTDIYDKDIAAFASKGLNSSQIAFELAKYDVSAAARLMAQIYESSNKQDGWVSLEVDPDLAFDSPGTLAAAKALHQELHIDNAIKNIMIKIPATKEGLGPIEDALASGISVNVTLIFSLERYREVYRAFLRGASRFAQDGGDLTTLKSVASFFVSRLDSAIDPLLVQRGRPDLVGTVALAQSKMAYQAFLEFQNESESQELLAKGLSPQRPLFASTSTKNPDFPDLLYVENLIGPNSVNTMPLGTLEALVDHGNPRKESVLEDIEGAIELLSSTLSSLDIDLVEVTQELERQGVSSFSKAWHALLEEIEKKIANF